MTNIAQGWTLTLLGLLVAFSAMAIFIGVIVLLKKLFPYKGNGETEETPAESLAPAAELPVTTTSSMEAEIAALAVAITVERQKNRSPIGLALQSGPGSWWMANQLSARQKAGLTRK